MIINVNDFSGKCLCGKTHETTTEFCVIEQGALNNFTALVKKYGFSGNSVAIYDENTYQATKGLHPNVTHEIILSPTNLHADEHGVALTEKQLPNNFDYLVAVGSGTIHDITRYLAYEKNLPFISCPTAASVDGFCSSVAAMTWQGFKKTFTAVAPKIVIADLNVIVNAPKRLTNSGVGDMLGKFIALTDWKISNILTGEYLCNKIYDMSLEAANTAKNYANKLNSYDVSAYEKLTYGLLLSGIAMQLLGNSRCASGAEHHVSHFIEMNPPILSASSTALHGEKVGVGTLIACKEYHEIANSKTKFSSYPVIENGYIEKAFGEKLSPSIIKENAENCAKNVTASALENNWDKIVKTINLIPDYQSLLKIYKTLGLNINLEDIGVSPYSLNDILEFSPLVRNRVTLMRLRKIITRKKSL